MTERLYQRDSYLRAFSARVAAVREDGVVLDGTGFFPAGGGAQLRRMAELFPDNDAVRQALIQWHLRAGDADGAEAVVRAMAARDQSDAEAALMLDGWVSGHRSVYDQRYYRE